MQLEWYLLMMRAHLIISAGQGSKMKVENRAARGRFSMGNLD